MKSLVFFAFFLHDRQVISHHLYHVTGTKAVLEIYRENSQFVLWMHENSEYYVFRLPNGYALESTEMSLVILRLLQTSRLQLLRFQSQET